MTLLALSETASLGRSWRDLGWQGSRRILALTAAGAEAAGTDRVSGDQVGFGKAGTALRDVVQMGNFWRRAGS